MAVECHVHAHPAIASVSAGNGQPGGMGNSAPYYSCAGTAGCGGLPLWVLALCPAATQCCPDLGLDRTQASMSGQQREQP